MLNKMVMKSVVDISMAYFNVKHLQTKQKLNTRKATNEEYTVRHIVMIQHFHKDIYTASVFSTNQPITVASYKTTFVIVSYLTL